MLRTPEAFTGEFLMASPSLARTKNKRFQEELEEYTKNNLAVKCYSAALASAV